MEDCFSPLSPECFLLLNSSIFSLPDVRINYTDQNANNILASKVGTNTGSLWSNIATVSYPLGLAGPAGEVQCGMRWHKHNSTYDI